jgi:uncharacterized protein
MARKKALKKKPETTLVPHRTPDLSALLERAKNGCSAAAVRAYLNAGGSAHTLVQDGEARAAQIPLMHYMTLSNVHPHEELAECVRLLVEADADINATASLCEIERTALMVAGMHTCCNEVQCALLQNGADVSVCAADGTTALHLAAVAGQFGSCKLLLERASSSLVHARNRDGGPPLMYAAGAGQLDLVQLLLQFGADVNTADDKSRPPLMNASLKENVQVVQCLLEAGADVNAVDSNGHCALKAAVQANSTALLQLLLKHGADSSFRDIAGQNALFKAAH